MINMFSELTKLSGAMKKNGPDTTDSVKLRPKSNKPDRQMEILKALAHFGTACSNQLAHHTGISRETASAAIRRLDKKRFVEVLRVEEAGHNVPTRIYRLTNIGRTFLEDTKNGE